MILSLTEAKKVNPRITQEELDAYEQQIRTLTNNKFHHPHIRNKNLAFVSPNTVVSSDELIGFEAGDTVEIVNTLYSNGLWIIKEVVDKYTLTLKIEDRKLIESAFTEGVIVKVDYPADLSMHLKEVIQYKYKMTNKTGIKTERVSRTSVTYHDVNSADNVEGIPSSYWSFIKKYRKIRW